MTTDKAPVEAQEQVPRVPAWVGDLAIMVLIVASIAIPGPRLPLAGPGAGPDVPVTVITVAAVATALLIPLRRRWPMTVFAVSLTVYVATVLLGVPTLVPGIAAVVAVFTATSGFYRTLPWFNARRITLTCGALGAGVVALLSLLTDERMVLDPQVFQIAAGIAIATALGDSARSRREYARAATDRAERAEQTREAEAQRRVAEERLRIAQDLHDTVAHRISVISLNAGVASSALDSRPEKARESLGTIRSASREVLGDIGVLLRYLRDGDSADSGDSAVPRLPQHTTDDLDALVTSVRGAGLDVDAQTHGDLSVVDDTTGRVVYRVAQEGLTNAHKHGSGGTARLRISVEDDTAVSTVTVQVSNPVSGEGRNQPDAPRGHLGLTGLRERAASVGGTIDAVESSGSFVLTADLPFTRH